MSIHSYNSIYRLGHKAVEQLLTVPCYVQEKVDGSQFSFGVPTEGDYAGMLQIRSKGVVMVTEAPMPMFTKARDTALRLFEANLLHPGYVYRGEYFQKPHQSTLTYKRIPRHNIILFDIDKGGYDMMTHREMVAEAELLGLEYVPELHTGPLNYDILRELLQTESVLGGQKIEGVVIKQIPPVKLWAVDKKPLMGKFVSEEFKEVHRRTWGEANPNQQQVIDRIVDTISGPARWRKAIMAMKEAGVYTGTVKDIGGLVKWVQEDLEKECKPVAEKMLMEHFWSQIRRMSGRGVPEFYKSELAREVLNTEAEAQTEANNGSHPTL